MTILFSLRSSVVRLASRAKAPMGTSFSWFPLSLSVRRACRLAKALGSSVLIRFSLRSRSSRCGYGARSPGTTQRRRFRLRSSSLVSVGMPSGTPDRRLRWQDTERSCAAQSQRGGQPVHGTAGRARTRTRTSHRSRPRPHNEAMSLPPLHSTHLTTREENERVLSVQRTLFNHYKVIKTTKQIVQNSKKGVQKTKAYCNIVVKINISSTTVQIASLKHHLYKQLHHFKERKIKHNPWFYQIFKSSYHMLSFSTVYFVFPAYINSKFSSPN